MTTPLKPTLNRITQTSTFSVNGQLQPVYNVNFSVGTHGPFTAQIPAEQFTPKAVIDAMQKVADQINTIEKGS
jgi:hypothetical protein